jgi:hypothetical protein
MGGTKKLTGKYLAKALKMLKDVTQILENEGIPYILDGGTLLGIVRENRLLPWDTDLDAAVRGEHAKRVFAVRWRMWLAGYRTRIRRYKKDMGPFKKGMPRLLRIQTRKFFFFKDVSLMDIFFKTLFDNEYFWVVDDKRPVLKSCPRDYYERLSKIDFNGKAYSVPQDYKGYLTNHYGDWQVVKKDWNSRLDDAVNKVELVK